MYYDNAHTHIIGSRSRDGCECVAHYDIMGYFDPSRITESTTRGFDSREPARSRASFGSLRVLSIWKQDGRKNETLKKDETRKCRLWKEDGKSGRGMKEETKRNVSIGLLKEI